MLVEICLSDVQSAANAAIGGATSIELCVDRIAAGGVTPSFGLISKVVEVVNAINSSIKVHVLIRPRDGNFVYSKDEFDIILHDIEAAKRAGAHGVVVGILTGEGKIDIERMRTIRNASLPLNLTFHRAFDVIDMRPFNAVADSIISCLEDVIALGCDRLLTSGTAATAYSDTGVKCLKLLTEHASSLSSSLIIIAASGVTPQNTRQLIADTGVQGIHAGTAVTFAVSGADMSTDTTEVKDFATQQIVNVELVQKLVVNSMIGSGTK